MKFAFASVILEGNKSWNRILYHLSYFTDDRY